MEIFLLPCDCWKSLGFYFTNLSRVPPSRIIRHPVTQFVASRENLPLDINLAIPTSDAIQGHTPMNVQSDAIYLFTPTPP